GRKDEGIDHALRDLVPILPIAIVAAPAFPVVDLDGQRLVAAGDVAEGEAHAGSRRWDDEDAMGTAHADVQVRVHAVRAAIVLDAGDVEDLPVETVLLRCLQAA